MYSVEQIQKGIASYLDTEFMPMLDEGSFKKVLVGAAISLAINKYTSLIPVLQENPFVKSLDVIDSEGNVDVDTLAAAIKENMPTTGVEVEIPTLGKIRLKSADADKLVEHISKAR